MIEELGENETAILKGERPSASGQAMRFFTKKALILVAMRSRTINAAAFRDWLAAQTCSEMATGYEALDDAS